MPARRTKAAHPPAAKLSAPRLPAVHARTRLFAVLDRALKTPALWIEGPPGAGKTTLAASWLKARKRPCVWYQVDSGDTDAATLFHYLGLAAKHAAPRYKRPLPHLTPEYLPGLDTFARRYFEELFRRLPKGSVLVLDNAQDAGGEGAFNDLLRVAIESLPAHVRILCLSRASPPPALARLIANTQVAVLEPAVIRLTLEEARGVAALHGVKDGATISAIHDRTRGWTAGLVLMLERAGADAGREAADPQTLFDYFATEILRRLDEGTRDLLLKSALLPKMSAADVESLTGNAGGGSVIANLQRRNYFTYRLSPKEAIYEYHPLFREFLLAHLRDALAPPELDRLRSGAARLLDASGQIESAADLWHAAGDWPALANHARTHAGKLIKEGRARVVESWLVALPEETIDADPWLRYWQGACRMAVDPDAAAKLFAAAHERFRERGDAVGVFLAWAGAVDAVWLEQKDSTVFDGWIERLEQNLVRFGAFPGLDVEASVMPVVIWVLMWRRPWHADMARWVAKALPLLERTFEPALKARLAGVLLMYYRFTGDAATARLVAGVGRRLLAGRDLSSVAMLFASLGELYDATFGGRQAEAVQCARALLEKSAATGLHVLDHLLNGLAAHSALSEEDLEAADEFLGGMERALSGRPQTLDTVHWQCLRGWRLRIAGDFTGAVRHTRWATDLAVKAGAHQPEIVFRLGLAHALFDAGNYDAAREENDEARAKARAASFPMHVFECAMFDARLALARGDELAGTARLREAFSLADRSDVTGWRPFWRRDAWARLHAAALERGVLPEVVRRRIREENLARYGPESYLESWPWRVRIRVLGRFSVLRGDKPLAAAGRGAKPLDLLKALVALGGRGVGEAELAEMLWPNADGDRAHSSLKVNVHRLRRLLGEECIVWGNGLLSLAARHAWVDAWALERALGALESALAARQEAPVAALAAAAVALNRGAYLRADTNPWTLGARERLRAKFLRIVGNAAEALVSAGNAAEAMRCYEKSLEVDPAAERFYQGLMRCHLDLGERADGLAVYQRCRETLARELALSPSPKTEALRTSLLST